jgi:integrase/recombinase XerD
MADDPLFVTKDGERFNYRRLRYWLLTLNRAAGLRDRSLHSLRHTAGVQWAANGVPMNEIQSLLGHASINTTGIYTEVAARGLIDAVKSSEANRLIMETLNEMEK